MTPGNGQFEIISEEQVCASGRIYIPDENQPFYYGNLQVPNKTYEKGSTSQIYRTSAPPRLPTELNWTPKTRTRSSCSEGTSMDKRSAASIRPVTRESVDISTGLAIGLPSWTRFCRRLCWPNEQTPSDCQPESDISESTPPNILSMHTKCDRFP